MSSAPGERPRREGIGSDCRLMVLSDAIPERNGVGTYYSDLMGHLAGRLGAVDLIPARANCVFRKEGWSVPLPGDGTQRLYCPHVPRILRRVRELRPELIITPSVGPFALLTLLLTRGGGRRMILGHHTSFDKLSRLYWTGLRARFNAGFIENWLRVLMRSAAAVVVNTPEMEAEARRFGARRVHCVGTTLAPGFTTAPPTPCDGSLRRVIFAGRLAPEKNVAALVEAARVLPELIFEIVGDGPDRAALESRARGLSNVRFLGWLPREALLPRLDAADLFVLPSQLESFGSVALEAMARGRLVLVSSACGILQWPGLAAGLLRFTGSDDLVPALRRLLATDPGERASLARLACRRALEMNERTTRDWIDLLEQARQRHARKTRPR